jgi:hypothetical protein
MERRTVNYKYLTSTTLAKIDDDGISRMSCSIDNEEFKAWLAEGNTPLPADPLPPPVYICSPWQIRKALNNLSLRQAVEDAVAASNDQTLKDGWEFATEFRSNDPFVISMGASLGKNEQETAELIQYASTL